MGCPVVIILAVSTLVSKTEFLLLAFDLDKFCRPHVRASEDVRLGEKGVVSVAVLFALDLDKLCRLHRGTFDGMRLVEMGGVRRKAVVAVVVTTMIAVAQLIHVWIVAEVMIAFVIVLVVVVNALKRAGCPQMRVEVETQDRRTYDGSDVGARLCGKRKTERHF